MTTLWFFKRLKSHPGYLMCSDRTIYNKRNAKPLTSHPNRQGVARAQLVDKPNRKRVMRSFEYLFRVTFMRPLPQTVQQETDCPF